MDGGNLDFLLFSNAPNGDFDGFCGFIRRITLMVYMGLDNVLNRQETRYDTTLVIGLTACAMGIFSFFVYFIMKVQSCQTLFCGTPGALNQLPEIVDEDEDDKDEDKTKVDEQTSTEDSISTGSDLSVQGRSPKLGKRGRSKKSPKGKHRNKELINHFMQAADVGHCLFNYNDRKKSPERQPRVQVGIRKIITIYGRKQGYLYFTATEALQVQALNKVMYPRPKGAKKSPQTKKLCDAGVDLNPPSPNI